MNPKDNKKPYTPGKKVFDVSRPGKTPAQPGARPVITNRDTIDDPDISSKRSLLNSKQKITITPADNDTKEQKPAVKPQPKEPTGPPPVDQDSSTVDASVTKKDKPGPKPTQAEPPKPDIAEQEQPIGRMEPTAYEEPSRELSPDELTTKKPEEPTHRERVEPMHMGMPQEFNPSGAIVSQHGKHRTLWLEILSVLVILILLAAIANLLLDAEIIKTNLNIPHTNFFEQT